jgi:hypothetical protein
MASHILASLDRRTRKLWAWPFHQTSGSSFSPICNSIVSWKLLSAMNFCRLSISDMGAEQLPSFPSFSSTKIASLYVFPFLPSVFQLALFWIFCLLIRWCLLDPLLGSRWDVLCRLCSLQIWSFLSPRFPKLQFCPNHWNLTTCYWWVAIEKINISKQRKITNPSSRGQHHPVAMEVQIMRDAGDCQILGVDFPTPQTHTPQMVFVSIGFLLTASTMAKVG